MKKWIFIIFFAGCVLRMFALYPPELRFDPATVALQALQIQDGDRPIFWAGQAFMGTLGSYLAAIAFELFGSNTFTMSILAFVMHISFIGLSILTAYIFFGSSVALVTSLLWMVPSKVSFYWAYQMRPDYQLCFIFTGILILWTHRLMNKPKNLRHSMEFFGLGLLMGISFWNNMAIGPCILACLLCLWYAYRGAFVRYYVYICGLGSMIGLMPVIYFNVLNGFVIAGQSSVISWESLKLSIFGFVTHAFPYFFSVYFDEQNVFRYALSVVFLVVISSLYITSCVRFIKNKEKTAAEILLFTFLVLHMAFATFSNFGKRFVKDSHPTLYITSLYLIAYIVIAEGILKITHRKLKLLVCLICILLPVNHLLDASHVYNRFFKSLRHPDYPFVKSFPESDSALLKFTRDAGLTEGYYGGRLRKMVQLFTFGRLCVSDVYNEHFVPWAINVDASEHPFYMNPGRGFEEYIRHSLKLDFKDESIDYPDARFSKDKGDWVLRNKRHTLYYQFKQTFVPVSYKTLSVSQGTDWLKHKFVLDRNGDTALWLNPGDEPVSISLEMESPSHSDETAAELVLFPSLFSHAPSIIRVYGEGINASRSLLFEVNDVKPVFWSVCRPYVKNVLPRYEFQFKAALSEIKTLHIEIWPNASRSVGISDIAIYGAKPFKGKEEEFLQDRDEIRQQIRNSRQALIVGDHYWSNFARMSGKQSHFISNATVTNEGFDNPGLYHKLFVPKDIELLLIVRNCDAELNKSVTDQFAVQYRGKYFSVFSGSLPSSDREFAFNGIYFEHVNQNPLLSYGVDSRPGNAEVVFDADYHLEHIDVTRDLGKLKILSRWKVLKNQKAEDFVFYHFLDSDGQLVHQYDLPLQVYRSQTKKWPENYVFEMNHVVGIPEKIQGEVKNFKLVMGVYRPRTQRQMKIKGQDKRWIEIGLEAGQVIHEIRSK